VNSKRRESGGKEIGSTKRDLCYKSYLSLSVISFVSRIGSHKEMPRTGPTELNYTQSHGWRFTFVQSRHTADLTPPVLRSKGSVYEAVIGWKTRSA